MDDYNKQLKIYNAKLIANKKKYIENVPVESSVEVSRISMQPVVEDSTTDQASRAPLVKQFLETKFSELTNSNFQVVQFIMDNLTENDREFLYSFWNKFETKVVDYLPKQVSRNMFVQLTKNFISRETGTSSSYSIDQNTGEVKIEDSAQLPDVVPLEETQTNKINIAKALQARIDAINTKIVEMFVDFYNDAEDLQPAFRRDPQFKITKAMDKTLSAEIKAISDDVKANDPNLQTLSDRIRVAQDDIDTVIKAFEDKQIEIKAKLDAPSNGGQNVTREAMKSILGFIDDDTAINFNTAEDKRKGVSKFMEIVKKISDRVILDKISKLLTESIKVKPEKLVDPFDSQEKTTIQNDLLKDSTDSYLRSLGYAEALNDYNQAVEDEKQYLETQLKIDQYTAILDMYDNNYLNGPIKKNYDDALARVIDLRTKVFDPTLKSDADIKKKEEKLKDLIREASDMAFLQNQIDYILYQKQQLQDIISDIQSSSSSSSASANAPNNANNNTANNNSSTASVPVTSSAGLKMPAILKTTARAKDVMKAGGNIQQIGDKYYIDTKNLNNNLLHIKYIKTQNNVPTFKPILISDELKALVKHVIKNKTIDEGLMSKVSKPEMRIFGKFAKFLNMQIEDADATDDDKQFKILLGEYSSGNDSEIVRKELKKYIIRALQEGKMPKNQAYQYLIELSY